jgi:hypothetical protein
MNKIVILGVLMSVMACNPKNKTENENKENKEKINSSLKKMYYEENQNLQNVIVKIKNNLEIKMLIVLIQVR